MAIGLNYTATDKRYSILEAASVSRLAVEDGDVTTYAASVADLSRQASILEVDPLVVGPARRAVREILFDIRTTPAPLRLVANLVPGRVVAAISYLELLARAVPALSDQAAHTSAALTAVSSSSADVLTEAIRDRIPDDARLAIHENRQLEFLNQRQNWRRRLIPRRALPSKKTLTGLVLLGRAVWYPSWVLAGPISRRTWIVQFKFEDTSQVAERVFGDGRCCSGARVEIVDDASSAPAKRIFHVSDIEPQIDWTKVRTHALANSAYSSGDLVPARLFQLPDGATVLLEGAAGASTETVVQAEDGLDIEAREVKRVRVDEYLLLRTEGGGGLIPVVADALLGPEATRLREEQEQWKHALADEVRASDTLTVAVKLFDLGAVRAEEYNVRNWSQPGPTPIRPQNQADFAAICRLIGRESELSELWSDMGILMRAHRSAGQRVRKELRKALRGIDEDLYAHDRLDVHLTGGMGGTLSAIRVVGIDPETHRVPLSAIHRIV